ncbi:hypothetical protein T439DRAFT_379516 [Meredithblackwellia eburnea MCA 4105]
MPPPLRLPDRRPLPCPPLTAPARVQQFHQPALPTSQLSPLASSTPQEGHNQSVPRILPSPCPSNVLPRPTTGLLELSNSLPRKDELDAIDRSEGDPRKASQAIVSAVERVHEWRRFLGCSRRDHGGVKTDDPGYNDVGASYHLERAQHHLEEAQRLLSRSRGLHTLPSPPPSPPSPTYPLPSAPPADEDSQTESATKPLFASNIIASPVESSFPILSRAPSPVKGLVSNPAVMPSADLETDSLTPGYRYNPAVKLSPRYQRTDSSGKATEKSESSSKPTPSLHKAESLYGLHVASLSIGDRLQDLAPAESKGKEKEPITPSDSETTVEFHGFRPRGRSNSLPFNNPSLLRPSPTTAEANHNPSSHELRHCATSIDSPLESTTNKRKTPPLYHHQRSDSMAWAGFRYAKHGGPTPPAPAPSPMIAEPMSASPLPHSTASKISPSIFQLSRDNPVITRSPLPSTGRTPVPSGGATAQTGSGKSSSLKGLHWPRFGSSASKNLDHPPIIKRELPKKPQPPIIEFLVPAEVERGLHLKVPPTSPHPVTVVDPLDPRGRISVESIESGISPPPCLSTVPAAERSGLGDDIDSLPLREVVLVAPNLSTKQRAPKVSHTPEPPSKLHKAPPPPPPPPHWLFQKR